MSGGLMSCVRENSPPLEMDINVSGPLSLPEPSINNSDLMGSLHSSHHNIMSSTPLAAQSSSHLDAVGSSGGTPLATPPNTEQTKRRRFHPLRNLRRIFRRRTITSPPSAAGETPTSTLTGPAASSNSEKNLRSATLGATSVVSVASASSPSSPLTHQQLQDAYLTQSLPKSKSAYSSLLGGKKYHQSHDYNLNGGGGGNETKSKSKYKHKNHHKQQSKEFEHQQQQQSEDMFGTTTQTSASYHHVQHHTSSTTATSGTSASTKSSLLSQRQSMGVAVFPAAMNRSFFTERQKLRSVGDSSQDLDSGSGNDSGTGGGHNTSAGDRTKSGGGGSASGGEMSDSQRSLSEGRLVDSDYSRDGLSQSHDSVFSESATASSLSIVLKAELADVLRKRRNRPDASDEDLGLPRSPASPQRRAGHGTTAATASAVLSSNTKSTTGEKYTEISSVSLLSMNSTDGEDAAMATSTANNSTASNDVVQERTTATRYSRSSTMSSISMTNDILRHRDSSFADVKDEVDLFSSDWQRLSHSAAKHKMAIRPIKKKGGPSRQHRRTLETSIPEANEDLNRFVNKQILEVKDLDIKAKTRSLPPSVNAAKLMDEQKQAINVKNTATSSNTTTTKESVTKTTKIINTTTSSTTTSTTNLTTTNLFGLRNLTAKASAMFESKDSNAVTERKEEEMTKKTEELPQKTPLADKSVVQPMETTETGFLRRLMHRNSKRSIAKANAGEEQDQDELDKKQNEPKKLQMSTNTNTVTQLAVSEEKSKNEFIIHESKLEEKRKEIKKELYNESKTVGLTSMVNNFTMPSKEEKKPEDKLSPSKPKSGPAARQRYLPQNISNEDLMKLNEEKPPTKESKISKTSLNETFQSTSIIREITKQQSSISNSATKVEHHFEKKPKIVGLSAFQQKISRSNDSFARNNSNNSLISLDKSEEDLTSTPLRLSSYEQKQRKSVEKSRSFRAYGEQKDLSPNGVHNNMPSLPDLSLNLRVPYCRDFILNEKEYSSPSPPEPLDEKHASLGFEINDNKLVKPEREIRKSFGNYDKNIIMTTSTAITPSKTTPTKLLTPGNVVSTFSTSSSSSASTCNKNISEIENNIDLIVKSPFVSVIRKSINLSEDQAEEVVKMSAPKVATEKVRPTVLNLKKENPVRDEFNLDTPSTASVTLREKAIVKTNTLFISNLENSKELERKSAPANNSATKSNGFRANSTRRSSSVVESIEDKPKSSVPEFMKIQLNRVDATRTSKSHVVLAKNIKEASPPSRESTPEKNSSMDDLSFRRLSSESVDINERDSPETEKRISGLYYEAINKHNNKVCSGLPPKSPIKKTPTTPTTPPTPTINERDSQRESFKLPESFESTSSSSLSHTNSLSLQERRRLFMNEEKAKLEKKVEEIKYERKKSICEDISRKSSIKSETEQRDNDNTVILRKKSFASSVHSLNGNSLNNNNSLNNGNTNTNNNTTSVKDDATPELMKVFARRSLKIKDEDLDKMLINSVNNNNNNLSNATQSLKKFTPTCSQPSVDSDKENQSASDEKLDKLPKLDLPQSITITKSNSSQTHTSTTTINGSSSLISNSNGNRNSLADFRLASNKTSNTALSPNNSNNNNHSSQGETTSINNSPKSFLPPIKIQPAFRAISIERSNNNSNNNNNNPLSPTKTSCSTLERSTIKLGDLTTSSSTDSPIIMNKTIERSATMGEFKGIHQRRAEWEQRAKEALK